MKPTRIASRYRVIRELGRGGMGVVYVVEHLHTGEHLALKLLHGTAAKNPSVISRFKREARAGALIKSEHVVRVIDADVAPELDGAPFFVMDLLEGFDLERALDRIGGLAPKTVLEILSQIGQALDKAHAIGIVHRDLKPENIFVHLRSDDTSVVKILDFGISKFLLSEGTSGFGTTVEGTLMGTPAYMAPEQAQGSVEMIGPATDVWAVGLVALRLLTNDTYWSARNQAELMVQILVSPLSEPSSRWPWLGRAFDVWFARSCNRDPAKRWSSVSEQVKALAEVLGEAPAQAASTTNTGASPRALLDALRHARSGQQRAGASAGPDFGKSMDVSFDASRDGSFDFDQSARRAATTGGPESLTVRPVERRRSVSRWVTIGIVALGLTTSAVAYRFTSNTPRALQATMPSAAGEVREPLEPSRPVAESPTVFAAGRAPTLGDAGAHSPEPIGSTSASAPVRKKGHSKPASPKLADDPMAP